MFFCTEILKKNNKQYGAIWLAAFSGKDLKKHLLTRNQIKRVDVSKACNDVLHPNVRFSLRLQSHLMIGIVRVYKEQVQNLCSDIKMIWKHLRVALTIDMKLINLHIAPSSKNACTLPAPAQLEFVEFPQDNFLMSPEELFPRDVSDYFIRIGDYSPASSTPSHSPITGPYTPPLGLYQAPKDDITMREPEELPGDGQIHVPGDNDLSPLPDGDEITMEREEPEIPDLQPGDYGVNILDPDTVELRPGEDEDTSISRKRGALFPDDMETPIGDRIQAEPVRPHKKPLIDRVVKISDKTMRDNLADPRGRTRDRAIDLPVRTSAAELMNNPCRPELGVQPLFNLWKRNAVVIPLPEDEVPNVHFRDAEIPLRGSPSRLRDSSEYERSGASSINFSTGTHVSPTSVPSGVGHRTRDRTLSPDILRDSAIGDFAEPGIEHLSPVGEVPIDDAEFDIGQISPLVPAPEMPDDNTFANLIRNRLMATKGDREQIRFSEAFAPRVTTKQLAARGFFQLLEWHREGTIVLSQPEGGFSDIYIETNF